MNPQSVATWTIILFGAFVFCASAIGFANPRWLIDFVRRGWKQRWALPTAVAARLLLGTALIYFAPYSKLPNTFRILGMLGLVAAVGLPILGKQRVDGIMNWARQKPAWLTRSWLVFGMLAGATLIFATID